MNCAHCEAALPLKARFCPSCGARLKTWDELTRAEPAARSLEPADEQDGSASPPPRDEGALRAGLIDCYLNFSISRELSEWLQELGLPSSGTMHEKLGRLRRQAGSLVLPAESYPRQTIYYLSRYDEETLSEICLELGIDATGPKERLLPRIYREVGLREGWLQPLAEEARLLITETFLPILAAFDHRKDYYRDLREELSDVLDQDHDPRAYGSALIAVLVPGFFQEAQMTLLRKELQDRVAQAQGRSSNL